MARLTLERMAAGGMYDLVGGGFHRYSVDADWLVPHFEKMLYDNALLAPAYLHGWVVTGDERFRRVAEETLDYLVRELRLPEGGFASSQDADTDGVEGLTYTWTAEELEAVLGEPHEEWLLPFEHGRSILRADVPEDARRRLLEARDARPQPGRDDKALASWNGLALAAFAEAGQAARARRPARGRARARRVPARDALGRARAAAAHLPRRRRQDRRLPRGLRERRERAPRALLGDRRAPLARGVEPARAPGGRALRRSGARRLLRPAAGEDGPRRAAQGARRQPDAVGQLDARLRAAQALAPLRRRRARAGGGLASSACARPLAERAPSAVGHLLCALDLHFAPPREVVIVGEDEELRRAALAGLQPNTVFAFARDAGDPAAERVPLLAGKDLVDGRAAVYVCERFACRAPVTSASELQAV